MCKSSIITNRKNANTDVIITENITETIAKVIKLSLFSSFSFLWRTNQNNRRNEIIKITDKNIEIFNMLTHPFHFKLMHW